MGRKGRWFSSLKKALTPESKEKKGGKSKKKWPGEQQQQQQKQVDSNPTPFENVTFSPPPTHPQPEELKFIETTTEQNEHAHSDPVAISVAAEPASAAVWTTTEVVQVAKANKFAGKTKEEVAAIKVQTAFRGYLARRALRALRALVRLKSLMEGPTVKRQSVHTLRCMQTLARVQTQIHSRRVRMSEENQALQKQLLRNHAKELENLRMGEEWDDSLQSKEQIEANLLQKYEATMRRERALAYAFTHQQSWKNPSRSANPMFMNYGNPSWGWSWLERWMAAHLQDSKNMTEKELNNDQSSVKSGNHSIAGEISKSYARYQLNSGKLLPGDAEKPSHTVSQHSPSTPSKPPSPAVVRKLKLASPRSSIGTQDDDSRSVMSTQSYRRHSIAGSTVQDHESLGSSTAVPSYMVSTESARAKTRLQSPLGPAKNGGMPEKEKGPSGIMKKRLSYPPSPAKPRRHSGPPKLESNFVAENGVANGDGI